MNNTTIFLLLCLIPLLFWSGHRTLSKYEYRKHNTDSRCTILLENTKGSGIYTQAKELCDELKDKKDNGN